MFLDSNWILIVLAIFLFVVVAYLILRRGRFMEGMESDDVQPDSNVVEPESDDVEPESDDVEPEYTDDDVEEEDQDQEE
jgi:hypothetical protein